LKKETKQKVLDKAKEDIRGFILQQFKTFKLEKDKPLDIEKHARV
jgi:hypothetical protein